MENKKPLIIVPPLSEPMAKLKEVLEGIAQEENIEIFTVEDAKEFGQLIGSGGQSLVMISSAKICVTLLQEYRTTILKNHTKVILLTPKEIPQKTLEKFRKIGLTESIVESIAPKTLLYKVKLQLKSIKIVQKEENTQNLIKSMAETAKQTKVADDLILENSTKDSIEAIAEEKEDKKRKMVAVDDGESMDYLSNLAGKKTQAEDVIETHWKSKREKTENFSEDDGTGNMKTKSDEQSLADIDMYYRGKQKKEELQLEEAEDLYKKKISMEEEAADYDLKKHKTVAEELEPAEKRKKIQLAEEDNDFYDQKEKKAIADEIEAEKKKKAILDQEEDFDLEALQKKLLEQIEAEKEEDDLTKKEDLGGHYKGKITKQEFLETEEDEITQERHLEETYEKEAKKKREELEEIANDDFAKKPAFEAIEEDNPHEGQVDQIDTFMRGDLESTEEIKTRMESNSEKKKDQLDEVDSDDIDKKKNQLLDEEISDFKDKKDKHLEEENADFDLRREKLLSDEESEDYQKEALDLQEEDSEFQKRALEKTQKEEEEKERERAPSIKLIDDRELNDSRSTNKEEEDELRRREIDNSGLDLDKSRDSDVHEGKTDKISTYYKSGESKDKDQDWNLTHDKKNTQLDIEKAKKAELDLGSLKKAQYGEEVIDYRKMKEEFDQIARGELNPDGTYADGTGTGARNGINAQDSFKVIEIGPTPFDFAVEILNELYSPDVKSKDIIKMVANKLIQDEKGYLTVNIYSLKDKKYNESFSSYSEFSNLISEDVRFEWLEIKENESNLTLFTSFTMPTWMCRSIPDNNTFWRDIELPTWANKELTNKKVELVYPFFDGVDRMGYAHIYFPLGIKPENDRKIQITIEMLRSIFLETIQRSQPTKDTTTDSEEQKPEDKKNNVLNFFGGIFGKNKAS